MEVPVVRRALLVAGTSHPQLAAAIAGHLGVELCPVDISRFASGEVYVRFLASVRGCDAFVVQSHAAPVNEMIMELLVMIDALKRASVHRINAVIPYFGYARQDKKTLAREPISARLVADLLRAAGADRVLSVDLHTGQIQGFFDVPVDHLTALPVLADHVMERYGDDELIVVAPDPGRGRMAQKYAHHLGCGIAFMQKARRPDARNVSIAIDLVGDVRGMRCVVIDDMIDTAGTITNVLPRLLDAGASSAIAVATHAVLSAPATQRLAASAFDEVVVTDTLPLRAEQMLDKLTVITVAPLIAASIRAVFEDASVSELFHGENLEAIPPDLDG